jgi:hypothetical protein
LYYRATHPAKAYFVTFQWKGFRKYGSRRDLQKLVDIGLLQPKGRGRAREYIFKEALLKTNK